MTNPSPYDIIIIGAGPAGASCALQLADKGLKVALLDRAKFPRDKVCGDALSVDVVNQLEKISPDVSKSFHECTSKLPSFGVTLVSPDLTHIDIPFIHRGFNKSGYICSRWDFDNLLFQEIKRSSKIDIIEECNVDKVEVNSDKCIVHTANGKWMAEMVVGADGAHSVVRKLLRDDDRKSFNHSNQSAGLRMYFEGVAFLNERNFIELYFFKDILPGYLWLFPMEGNKANVGIGMLSSSIARKKINLRKIFLRLLSEHPLIRERFVNARPLETPKGHSLPLGSKRRSISGERFALLGDAAGLIDPFTGEGIGNAIRSGRVAAEHITRCFEEKNFSASFNKSYDQEIYQRMWNELSVSKTLQRMCQYPALFNFIMKKAGKNKFWHQFLVDALADVNTKKKLLRPGFYYQMLFKADINKKEAPNRE